MQNYTKNQTIISDISSDKTCFYTSDDSFQTLCAIQKTALSLEPKPDFSAALKAEELKGKLFGLYNDKKEKDKFSDTLPQILVEFIEKHHQSERYQQATNNPMPDDIDYI